MAPHRRWIGPLVAALVLGCAGVPASPPRALLEARFDVPDGPLRREAPPWRVVRGAWRIEDGALVADALEGEAYVTIGDPRWRDYAIEVRAAFLDVREPTRWLSILFRAPRDGAPPWSHCPIRQGTDARNGAEFAVRAAWDRWSVRAAARGPSPTGIGRERRLRVDVRGERVAFSIDGRRVLESPFCVDRAAGCVGLGASGCVARFDDLVVRRLPPPPAPPVLPRPARCLCIAHRGFSRAAPENTLAAVARGIAAGAGGIEFDVRVTRERVPVLMHDETVDRTTNGTGRVADLTAAEVARLDAGSWKGPAFAGEPVPTLRAVLARIKGTRARAVIEIKPRGIAREVVAAVRAAGMLDASVVISFEDEALAAVRALQPRLPCALLVGRAPAGDAGEQARALTERARRCGAEILDLAYTMLSPELVASIRRRGFPVWAWTVDEPPVMAALARWGVEAITTNRPDLLAALRDKAQPAGEPAACRGAYQSDRQ